MNMTRTMECMMWIACQDQIYGRIMDICRIMYGGCARDMSSEHIDGQKESEKSRSKMERDDEWQMESWKCGMDGACPQCRVQVEEEK